MSEIINIYCDESCHLPNDRQEVMVLGAIRCPLSKTREIAKRLREIKQIHNLPPDFEVKWNKVSQSKLAFYQAWVDYFFDDDDLGFRAVVASKSGLQHAAYDQDHDTWYYKMMFLLLGHMIQPDVVSRIYLDKKDTRSADKVKKLHDVLCNDRLDFNHEIVERVQIIESHAVEQMQLADLLLGAVGYINRGLASNAGKLALIQRIKARSHYSLTRTTLLQETKFNLFKWQGRQMGVA